MPVMAKKRPRIGNPWPARLKAIRKRLGITQEEAAAQTDVSIHTWVAWENDQRRPGRMALKLLKKTFPGEFAD